MFTESEVEDLEPQSCAWGEPKVWVEDPVQVGAELSPLQKAEMALVRDFKDIF